MPTRPAAVSSSERPTLGTAASGLGGTCSRGRASTASASGNLASPFARAAASAGANS